MTRADRLWVIIAIFAVCGAWALGGWLREAALSWTGLLLLGACSVIVLLPSSIDPAIRLKEWLEKRRNP